MSADLALGGPFEVTLDVRLVGLDGTSMAGRTAKASITLRPGDVPDADTIVKAIKTVREQAGDEFRLASRHEFVNELLAERSGTNIKFAVPGPDTFTLDLGDGK